jgi:drug/metabolite transporter (DMT)-like permease
VKIQKIKSNPLAVYIALVGAMLIWAISFIWSKQALQYYNPVTVVLFRLVIATLFLLPYLRFSGRLQKLHRKDRGLIFIMAFCEPFIYFMGEAYGIKLVSPAVAAVIISTLPLFTPVAAAIFLKDKFSVFNFLGILVSLTGIIVLVVGPRADFTVSYLGLFFLFTSVIAGVAYSVLFKRVSKQYSVLNLVMYQNIIGIILFVPVFLILDVKSFISIGWVWESVLPIIKLSIFATSIAYFLYTFALRQMDISKVNVFTNIIPVFTIIFSYFFLGELITERKLIGILIVIAGVFVSQMNSKLNNRYGYIHRNIVKRFKRSGKSGQIEI